MASNNDNNNNNNDSSQTTVSETGTGRFETRHEDEIKRIQPCIPYRHPYSKTDFSSSKGPTLKMRAAS